MYKNWVNIGQRIKNKNMHFLVWDRFKGILAKCQWRRGRPRCLSQGSFRFYTLSTSSRTVNEGGETWAREVTPLTFETVTHVVEMEPANNLLFTQGKVKAISTKCDWIWFCKDNVQTVRRCGCFSFFLIYLFRALHFLKWNFQVASNKGEFVSEPAFILVPTCWQTLPHNGGAALGRWCSHTGDKE